MSGRHKKLRDLGGWVQRKIYLRKPGKKCETPQISYISGRCSSRECSPEIILFCFEGQQFLATKNCRFSKIPGNFDFCNGRWTRWWKADPKQVRRLNILSAFTVLSVATIIKTIFERSLFFHLRQRAGMEAHILREWVSPNGGRALTTSDKKRWI